ncbi:putative bacitracin transporter ATP-binding protein [Gottschalkia purinilytica]|uniref:Putative bacitracin transporter ATP-binding protein n=1 Tax=Gottschalkia purinilytica TaxID=1503 RepID=A0A0L0WA12_GOTPU|nr:ATP-binding cassette domain-containing protein [Gottschalkia purinilytica]KNF08277.1 putative bacitracin transporter ATP-binding protein [Gottschalkia purinilytica]
MVSVLRTFNLTKEYRGIEVVKDLNLSINQGEIYSFVGRKGSGKTTTLKMILGLTKPSYGEVEIFGEKTFSSKMYPKVGSIIEFPGFYLNLTAQENLEIHRRLMGIPNKSYVKDALDMVGLKLSDIEDKKVKFFSLGMKQRLGIARALIHKPQFLILDEPTNGLDPIEIIEVRELLLNLCRKREITILVSSHTLNEIQQISSKIGIIHKGELLEELDFETLQNGSKDYLELKVNNIYRSSYILENNFSITDYNVLGNNNIRIYEKLDLREKINKELVSNDVEVKEISLKSNNLEDYFVRLTGGSSDD